MSGYSVVNGYLYDKVRTGGVVDKFSKAPVVALQDSPYDTALGFNLIRITPNLINWSKANSNVSQEMKALFSGSILGLVMNDFTYSLTSAWETMDYPKILDLGTISDFAGFSGGGEIGAVFKSKKVWKKSGDLTINPEIRIIDVNGTGEPLKACQKLLMYATSVGTNEIIAEDDIKEVQKALVSLTKKIGGGIKKISTGAITKIANGEGLVDASSANHAINTIVDIHTDGFEKMLEDIDDYAKLRVSPPPMKVQIGRIFQHNDMVLTNISFTFSKEVSSKGPLYVDITLTLVTRKIIANIDDTGLAISVQNAGDDLTGEENITIVTNSGVVDFPDPAPWEESDFNVQGAPVGETPTGRDARLAGQSRDAFLGRHAGRKF